MGEEEGRNGKNEEENEGNNVRIFVGGLGGAVTAEDLRNTFSSLGSVDSVDIVRTKGRSFAYFDFRPSSPKSLSKLFSTYNGCMWKGGRLRLEKAKEHYLHHLRHEWAEDVKLANSVPSDAVDATKSMGSPKKISNVLSPEKMEIQLFFPKLNKVKLLPFKGTGKHKYSFQRVEVPPLPTHFCDCEEHNSDPSQTGRKNCFFDLERQGGGIDEKEVNIMKSVMNKLSERECISKASFSGAGLAEEGNNATESVDDLLADETETDQLTDEENLVMNMVVGVKSRKVLSGGRGQETSSTNEEAAMDEPQTSKDRPCKNMLKSQRIEIVHSDKKRKLSPTGETDGSEGVSANPKRKGSAKEPHLHESAQTMEMESVNNLQSNTNISWSQKSAWKVMAGERDNASFCISHIMSATPEEKSKSDGVNLPSSTDHQHQKLLRNINSESLLSKEQAVIQPDNQDAAVNRSSRGASWIQKSSWTQLVGETNNSFSISQLLPGMNLEKQEQVKPKSMDIRNSTVGKNFELVKSRRSESSKDDSKALGLGNEGMDISTAPCNLNMVRRKNLETPGKSNEINASKKMQAAQVQTQQPIRNNLTSGENYSFMRSSSSMRDWMNAKASLSGSLKKKRKIENSK